MSAAENFSRPPLLPTGAGFSALGAGGASRGEFAARPVAIIPDCFFMIWYRPNRKAQHMACRLVGEPLEQQ